MDQLNGLHFMSMYCNPKLSVSFQYYKIQSRKVESIIEDKVSKGHILLCKIFNHCRIYTGIIQCTVVKYNVW